MIRTGLLVAWMALAMASCRSARPEYVPPPADFPGHSADQILAFLPTPDSLWNTFSSDLAIAYSFPGESGTLNARVAYRRADSVLIRFRAPLGIEVSRALITPDSIFVYDRIEKSLYYGDRQVTERVLPPAFRSAEIAASLFGYDDLRNGTWTVRPDSSHYTLTSEDHFRTVIVDPGRWRIVATDERDAAGMIVEQRRFADFDRIDGRYLPRRIVTTRPEDDSRASISIRRLTPDPARLSFDMGVRSNVQRIPVY